VGVVFQTFNLLPTLTVLENAVLPAKPVDFASGMSTDKQCILISPPRRF
jgi:ABC-type lipoprotein export system ATPase subunit